MTNPAGAADFFALEAGECLDRLEVLITQPDGPKPAELLRYARALRGSALMANQGAIARAAAGFEGLARAVRDRGRPWDAATRERSAHAVDELRHLVRRVREWSDGDSQRAARVASDLDALAGSSSGDTLRGPVLPATSGGVETGVRAFVAREAALIASALDRAARTLETTPEAREPLYAVLRRLQSLRGLAEIGELTPLPEILDGIELAVGDLTRLFAPPANVPALLDSAAAALTRVARDVTERGRPDPDPEEARHFTERLLRAFATESDVVPVESLFATGDADPIQRSTAQPQFAPPSPLGAVEMVSYGEHLTQAADRITGAGSATARDLRLYSLVGILRSVAVPGSDAVTPALARFGAAARVLIGGGTAAREPQEFGAALREAGRLMSTLADGGDDGEIALRLSSIAARLELMSGVAAPRPAARPPVEAAPAASAPRPSEPPVVAVESLGYDSVAQPAVAADEPVPIAALAPDSRLPFERAFDTYRRLMGDPSIPAVAQAAPETVTMDIRAICYSGRGALERALEVRAELAAQLSRGPSFDQLEPLLQELLDLVPLAMDTGH